MALGPGFSLCSYKCPLVTNIIVPDETVLEACNITGNHCILPTLTIMIIEKFYVHQHFSFA